MLHGAPELIAQALDKLVDNARSFAPEQGWIRIRLQALENGARISVANNGPPLPEKMQERLFDSLVSVREGPAAGVAPHLGLGLFVVRLVADLHRGSAAAANLPEGEGVEFSLAIAGMPRRRL
jgi:signal transduction histidine kinase